MHVCLDMIEKTLHMGWFINQESTLEVGGTTCSKRTKGHYSLSRHTNDLHRTRGLTCHTQDQWTQIYAIATLPTVRPVYSYLASRLFSRLRIVFEGMKGSKDSKPSKKQPSSAAPRSRDGTRWCRRAPTRAQTRRLGLRHACANRRRREACCSWPRGA